MANRDRLLLVMPILFLALAAFLFWIAYLEWNLPAPESDTAAAPASIGAVLVVAAMIFTYLFATRNHR